MDQYKNNWEISLPRPLPPPSASPSTPKNLSPPHSPPHSSVESLQAGTASIAAPAKSIDHPMKVTRTWSKRKSELDSSPASQGHGVLKRRKVKETKEKGTRGSKTRGNKTRGNETGENAIVWVSFVRREPDDTLLEPFTELFSVKVDGGVARVVDLFNATTTKLGATKGFGPHEQYGPDLVNKMKLHRLHQDSDEFRKTASGKTLSACKLEVFDEQSFKPDEGPWCFVYYAADFQQQDSSSRPETSSQVYSPGEEVARRRIVRLIELRRQTLGYKLKESDGQLVTTECDIGDDDVAQVTVNEVWNGGTRRRQYNLYPAKDLADGLTKLKPEHLKQRVLGRTSPEGSDGNDSDGDDGDGDGGDGSDVEDSLNNEGSPCKIEAVENVPEPDNGNRLTSHTTPTPTRTGCFDRAATDNEHRPPSVRATPKYHATTQRSLSKVLDGMHAPGHSLAVGFEPAMYHPIFARFTMLYEDGRDKMKNSINSNTGYQQVHSRSQEDCARRDLVWRLSHHMSTLEVGEDLRSARVRPILRDLLGLRDEELTALSLPNRSEPDLGSLSENDALVLVAEEKSYSGSGSTTLPATQGLFNYLAFLQAFRKSLWNLETCCPCFLVTLTGPELKIGALVCPSQLHYTHLLSFSLVYSSIAKGDMMLWEGQIIFDALRDCLQDLKRYYKNFPRHKHPFVPTLLHIGQDDDIDRYAHPRLFPWPTSFLYSNPDGDERRVFFEYRWPLADSPTSSIFVVRIISSLDTSKNEDPHPEWDEEYRAKRAADDDWFNKSDLEIGKQVVIKFVRAYNEVCHRFMHSPPSGDVFAPKLYAMTKYECTKDGPLAGFGRLAVMEYLEGWRTLRRSDVEAEPSRGNHVIERLKLAIGTLHRQFVHGDLKAANFMVEPGPQPRVFVVDYDTAGAAKKDPHEPTLPARWSPRWRKRMNMGEGVWSLTREADAAMFQSTLEKLGCTVKRT